MQVMEFDKYKLEDIWTKYLKAKPVHEPYMLTNYLTWTLHKHFYQVILSMSSMMYVYVILKCNHSVLIILSLIHK